jgi:predicted ATPase
MKEAKAADYWRGLYKRHFPTGVQHLSYEDIAGIGKGEIRFSGGITAICGGNGVGKTTLLEAVLKSLDLSQGRVLGSARARFDNATLTVEGQRDGTPITRSLIFSNDGADPSALVQVTFLDPAAEGMRVGKLLDGIANFDELLQALAPRELDKDELEHLSYLVGKRYDKCLIYEVDEFGEESTFPYFLVEDACGAYGSEGMGFGEMSLHLINWYLERVPSRSVILIEEPETHLAPRSQDALMNTIARASVTRDLWVILSTHAPSIVRRIPREHIRLLVRSGTQTLVVQEPSRLQLNTVLGIKARFQGIVLVEDKAAREFTRALLDRVAPDISRTFQIVDMGSNSEVLSALNSFPRKVTWLSIVGLLDGDQRGVNSTTEWPCGFLPGDSGPEALLRSAADSERLSELLARDITEVHVVLAELAGCDDHDWLEEFPRLMGVSYESAVVALTSCWLESGLAAGQAEEIEAFVRFHTDNNTAQRQYAAHAEATTR